MNGSRDQEKHLPCGVLKIQRTAGDFFENVTCQLTKRRKKTGKLSADQRHERVAQLVELPAFNRKAAGSSPATFTIWECNSVGRVPALNRRHAGSNPAIPTRSCSGDVGYIKRTTIFAGSVQVRILSKPLGFVAQSEDAFRSFFLFTPMSQFAAFPKETS